VPLDDWDDLSALAVSRDVAPTAIVLVLTPAELVLPPPLD